MVLCFQQASKHKLRQILNLRRLCTFAEAEANSHFSGHVSLLLYLGMGPSEPKYLPNLLGYIEDSSPNPIDGCKCFRDTKL